MNSVQVDTIATVKGQPLGQAVLTALLVQQSDPLTWPEDRWLIGWSPWLGFGKGSVLECHLMLFHKDKAIFLRGPHKEAPFTVYDVTQTDFFPENSGRFVKAGEAVTVQLVANPTGTYAGIAANARIFSVLADTSGSPLPPPSFVERTIEGGGS